MKPKIAVFDFASCEGCELQIANLEEEILELIDRVDVVSFREVMKEHSDDYDIAFIEGSIERPMDEERIKYIRSKAKILIALGACACTGGVNKLRNKWPVKEVAKEVYGNADIEGNQLFDALPRAKAIDEVVKVDFYIRGCPVRKEQILYYIKRFEGMPPHTNLDIRFGINSRGMEPDTRTPIQYDGNKCILCRRCVATCNDALGVHAIGISEKGNESIIATPFDIDLEESNCIQCGQCVSGCPVGALNGNPEIEKTLKLLEDRKNYVVFAIDPVGIASVIDSLPTSGKDMKIIMKQLISALKSQGAKKVVNYTLFDYLSAAAQAEYIQNYNEPTFTSWCPSAHIYIKKFHPELAKYLHPESSPEHLMMENLKSKYGKNNLKVVFVTPCLTHKGNPAFDAVLGATELPGLLKALEVQLDFYPTLGVKFDGDLGIVEKFVTGGCSDYTNSLSIMRAAYLGKFNNLEAALTVNTHEDFIHELVFDSEEGFFNALVIEDMSRAGKFLKKDLTRYRVIELYPCYKGCLSGGGQTPTVEEEEIDRRKELLKSYKGEIESPYEFTSQIISAYNRMKGGE